MVFSFLRYLREDSFSRRLRLILALIASHVLATGFFPSVFRSIHLVVQQEGFYIKELNSDYSALRSRRCAVASMLCIHF